MKQVVMLAYFFPPEGNAGVYRPLRFVRHLSAMGWHVTVVTAEPHWFERYDPTLQSVVPADTKVVRVPVRDPWLAIQALRRRGIQRKLAGAPEIGDRVRASLHRPWRTRLRDAVRAMEAAYYRPDTAAPWVRPAVTAATNECVRSTPKAIWATIGPVSAGVVARRVAGRTGIPYVLDFRDPWGLSYYEWERRRPAWLRASDHRMMYDLLRDARAAVFLFEALAESYLRAYPGALDPAKIHIIPNGFEGRLEDPARTRNPRLTITYTGTLSTYRYDTLLESLRSLKGSDPSRAEQLRFRFVGDHAESFGETVRRLGLSDIVDIEPSVPFLRVAEVQRAADVLLLLGRESNRKGHEVVAGAKLFEYLRARRPVFAVLPNDEGTRILHSVGATTVCRVDSPADITAMLRKLLDHWSADTLTELLPEPAACEAYSATRQTAQLIRALEGAASATPFIPGSVEVPPSLQSASIVRSFG